MDRYLFRPHTTAADYRSYLQRLYGFVAPLETALATTDGLTQEIDLAPRARTALIAHDLLALGMTIEQIGMLPQCLAIPAFRGAAGALGWMYVIERPMLANAVIHRHLATRLPELMRTASAYLTSSCGVVGTMWRELGDVMDRVGASPAVADRIVAAAGDAFRTMIRWRMRDVGSWRGARYAV